MVFNTILFFISSALRAGTPIAVTALGACYSEKCGIINFGLEGIMVTGAFLGAIGSYISGSAWVGLLLAVLGGMFLALIHAVVTVTFGGNQSASSLSLIVIASGAASLAISQMFGRAGRSDYVNYLPTTEFLRVIPFAGDFLADLTPFVYMGIVLLVVLTYVLNRTPFGLRVITCGEHPLTADTAGINVHRIRYICILLSGALGGLGGASLSLGLLNIYSNDMVGGRGYLAMIAVIIGQWTPIGTYSASLIFGFFLALQNYIQMQPNIPVPSQIVQMTPYVLSLVILILTVSKKPVNPSALGKPFLRLIVGK
jgi:ABC-type uncharacterized transport system permease subunit